MVKKVHAKYAAISKHIMIVEARTRREPYGCIHTAQAGELYRAVASPLKQISHGFFTGTSLWLSVKNKETVFLVKN